ASVNAAIVFSIPVLAGPIAWVLLLRRNKPEGYAGDLFDQLVNGEGWSFAPRAQGNRLRNPDDEPRST
ncbi:MAG: hypothetical protein ACREIA_04600, partial [Opitutaceae bacterium]